MKNQAPLTGFVVKRYKSLIGKKKRIGEMGVSGFGEGG